MTMEDSARTEYSALLHHSFESERNALLCWTICGIAAVAMLGWGIGEGQPALMIPVVLVSALGFLLVSRWREKSMMTAGYLQASHEPKHGLPAYHTRFRRLQTSLSASHWHPAIFFDLLAIAATAFAWTVSSQGDRGELWAGVVTGGALVFGSFSISETARLQQLDPAALWETAEGGLREVSRQVGVR